MPASDNEAPVDPGMEKLEAAAFRQLIRHFRARQDVSNVDLMGWAGFCRNCMADWLVDASIETGNPLTVEEARNHVYGEPYVAFKERQKEATPEQLARMKESTRKNSWYKDGGDSENREFDKELADGFPASDPPSMSAVHH